jgi:Ni2+-binding GTPase involved in maturation of urease and hydrogenase
MTKQTVTVTISGPAGSGKARVADWLRSVGYNRATERLSIGNIDFVVVEQQDAPTKSSTMVINVDTNQVPDALAAIDRLAGTARAASKAIERLNDLTRTGAV